MIAAALSRAADRLLVTDPGLARLHNAARATLASLLTATVEIVWARHAHQPIAVAALGTLFAMIAPLFLRDARRADWFASLSLLYLCACACFAASAAAAPHAPWRAAGLLAVVFAGMLCQTCGPRAVGCALIAIVVYYVGIYLHPAGPEARHMLVMSAVAPLVLVLVGRLVIPDHPARTLRLAADTVALRAARLLNASATTARHPRADAHLSVLNEAALALEDQLAVLNPPNAALLRECLLELEVAAGHHALGDAAARADGAALERAIAHFEAAARRVGRAITQPAPRRRHTQAALPGWRDRLARLAWLPATRAATAAMLAMLIGNWLSPERWMWAVITTFVVFLGTSTREDTLYRGAQRLAGTFAGALVSVLLVLTLRGTPALLIGAMALSVFGWAYFILHAYGRGVFFITVLVGLVYGQLGFPIVPLAELRVEEVVTGCLVALAVAALVMPLAITRHAQTRLRAVLVALREAVLTSAAAPGSHPADAAAAALRALDRRWHELRVALRPLQAQQAFVRNPRVARSTAALLGCVHWARVLARSQAAAAASPAEHAEHADPAAARRSYASIVARLDALIASRPGATPAPLLRASAAADGAAPDAAHAQANALAQLDGALALLAERLDDAANHAAPHFPRALRSGRA